EKYLRQCLDSIVKQTLKDLEIICVNDGSTDNSLEILKEYQHKDKRIKVISKANSGYGATMNAGLENSRGEYIGIVESDDYIERNMYEYLYQITKLHAVDIVASNYALYYGKQNIKSAGTIFVPSFCNKVISVNENQDVIKYSFPIWTAIYKRKMLQRWNIRFNETPGASYQDTAFGFKTLISAKSIYITNKTYYNYRFDNTASSVNNLGKVFCICDEFIEIDRYLRQYPHKEQVYGKLKIYKQFKAYLWNYYRLDRKYKLKFLKKFSLEFQAYQGQHKLDKKHFSSQEWGLLDRVIKDYVSFYNWDNGILGITYRVVRKFFAKRVRIILLWLKTKLHISLIV
ncbi:MAG: glycosyltransferase, partial [Bacteroidales bacterium]|nr:glycosyltransferase [Bacteroidales bacterium]